MKKLEREVEDADEEREEEEEREGEGEEEEGSKSEEKKRKVKVNSGSGIMTTERFESLPISELSLNSIKEMNFQCLTQTFSLVLESYSLVVATLIKGQLNAADKAVCLAVGIDHYLLFRTFEINWVGSNGMH
ncbi:hypothetical protein RHMOL_Rhmol08G0112000 [Rhododendron molle]|uniref:Uncharacterized protein n=1 Tax=Rhododendron molle TaxID=49168 RepID=A0ACC0MN93_RHOML|nr:hypothetical protein RHMOL_Rhmol08G0112000 [Rhododendron molle]